MYSVNFLESGSTWLKTLYSSDVAATPESTQNLEIYNGGQLIEENPFAIDLGKEFWANCARYGFSVIKPEDGEHHLTVELLLVARHGIAQVFITDEQGQCISETPQIGALSGPTTLSFDLDDVGSCYVVFANATADSRPCVLELHAIRVILKPAADRRLVEQHADDPQFSIDSIFTTLSRKWHEIPAGTDRVSSTSLSELSDIELERYWQTRHKQDTRDNGWPHRGWYQALYRDRLRGKRVLDVGSGFGLDGIYFALQGAEMTFADIFATNLEVIERLCRRFDITNAQFQLLSSPESFDALQEYDVIWCQGSMINAPFNTVASECRKLLEHLPVGGSWIELCYPKERWIRDGSPPFYLWGKFTDGDRTPWMEWYDSDKLLSRLAPATFDTLLDFNFHNNDFNWFELVRTG